MNKQTPKSSRDLGLEFGAICGKFFLGIEHLHYGYWPADLDVNINNLRIAQEKYTDFLISHIPAGAQTILDVGCGSGQTAKRLIEMGHKVACVSPNPTLNKKVRQLLGDSVRIYECRYEDLETDDKFDLVLFSESFQYMKVDKAMAKTSQILSPTGWLLICDIFKKDIDGVKNTGGGHRLSRFYRYIANLPFNPVEDLDITDFTSPNLDLLDQTLKNVVEPILESTISFLSGRYPLMSKFMLWIYRRKIEKAQNKYFNGNRTSEDFRKFKAYKLFLYRNAVAAPTETHKAAPVPEYCTTGS